MDENKLTFTDLFEEVKYEIFKYLNLNERVRCRYVCREWFSILSRLLHLQEALVIGQPEFDSAARMKLSLCNINPRHIETPYNTIDVSEFFKSNTEDAAVFGRLLKEFKNLKSVFIYTAVKMRLSDLPDTIEHIHFGHNTANVIAFDKTKFVKLTCISTIDANLDEDYSDGIMCLLKAQQLQLENVSVCEVPRSICEQIIEMQNLKQLFVFDFNSDFDDLYKERSLEIMDAHPKLQYFNMFTCIAFGPVPETLCPTDNIKWLVEFGSTTKLDRQFVIDVFNAMPFVNTLEFAKDYVHGLHLKFVSDSQTWHYQTKLNNLKHLRLSFHKCISTASDIHEFRTMLENIFSLAPNIRSLHLRFCTGGTFQNNEFISMLLSSVCAFAVYNSKRSILFELSSFGQIPNVNSILPTNLNAVLRSIDPE